MCELGWNSLLYKFSNLHLSISSRACRSYPHPRFHLYFIAGYIATLCDATLKIIDRARISVGPTHILANEYSVVP